MLKYERIFDLIESSIFDLHGSVICGPTGRWFPPPIKLMHHDITAVFLKVALNTLTLTYTGLTHASAENVTL